MIKENSSLALKKIMNIFEENETYCGRKKNIFDTKNIIKKSNLLVVMATVTFLNGSLLLFKLYELKK